MPSSYRSLPLSPVVPGSVFFLIAANAFNLPTLTAKPCWASCATQAMSERKHVRWVAGRGCRDELWQQIRVQDVRGHDLDARIQLLKLLDDDLRHRGLPSWSFGSYVFQYWSVTVFGFAAAEAEKTPVSRHSDDGAAGCRAQCTPPTVARRPQPFLLLIDQCSF